MNAPFVALVVAGCLTASFAQQDVAQTPAIVTTQHHEVQECAFEVEAVGNDVAVEAAIEIERLHHEVFASARARDVRNF